MGLLPRVGRSFAFAQDDGGVVVPNVVRDLLGGVTAKSREVLRFAQDDGGVVVPNVVRDLPDGVIAKSREVLRVAQDDSILLSMGSSLRDLRISRSSLLCRFLLLSKFLQFVFQVSLISRILECYIPIRGYFNCFFLSKFKPLRVFFK